MQILATASVLNLCSVQFFGYGFCEVRSMVVNNSSLSFLVNSNKVITFTATITEVYDTIHSYENNAFCSLSLKLKLTIGGVAKYVIFSVNSSTGKLN